VRAVVEADADLVELRLDSMARPTPPAHSRIEKPAIVTCRPLREGGMFDGAERSAADPERRAPLGRIHRRQWDADARTLMPGADAASSSRATSSTARRPTRRRCWIGFARREERWPSSR
jgi:hypothetical protein